MLPELSLAEAMARLRTLLNETRFQPEDEGAPVQIMDVPESAGLVFDHLWITGVTDEQFPEEARPNPFLPLGHAARPQHAARHPGARGGIRLDHARAGWPRARPEPF